MPLPSARPPCTLKLRLAPAGSSLVCPLSALGWNHWCSSLSYGCASMSLKLVPTLGAPDVMPSSTPMGTTQECVRLEGSARSAIMRSGTLFSSGVNAVAFALSVSGPACCSRSNLPQQPDDLSAARRRPADVFLPSFQGRPTAIDFAVTAPQRLDVLGAPGSLVRREATHQQPPRQPTLSTSANTWTPRPSVVPRTFTSYLWWWKRLEPGPLRLPRP